MKKGLLPEQKAMLSQTPKHAGSDIIGSLEEAARFRAAVREGVARADRGEFVEDEEVLAWLERRERISKTSRDEFAAEEIAEMADRGEDVSAHSRIRSTLSGRSSE